MLDEGSPMSTLKGKVALVTGSTGGIGEAFVRAFAAQGCNVVLNGLGEAAAIERLRSQLTSDHGVEAVYDNADLAHADQVERMMREALERFGAVDILVNNAVTRHYAPVERFPVEKWNHALAVNLTAAFHTVRLALPPMKARNWGRIINMGSIHATRLVRDRIDYMTTKAAIVGMSKAIALECAQTGITCNAICPGWVLTPHAEGQIAARMREKSLSRDQSIDELLSIRQPSRRPILPAEVAALGVFLCSDAAANITGAALPIDGAWAVG
jgi:3-hydroxybutyrate dehydrogenase